MTRKHKSRANESLDRYLQEIGEVPLLTPDEEIELAKRIKNNDQEALEKLTQANLRFVVSVAKQYQNQGLSLGDLINEGNLGLIKAAKRFDETRGFKFISYAVWWIRQSILASLANFSRACTRLKNLMTTRCSGRFSLYPSYNSPKPPPPRCDVILYLPPMTHPSIPRGSACDSDVESSRGLVS